MSEEEHIDLNNKNEMGEEAVDKLGASRERYP